MSIGRQMGALAVLAAALLGPRATTTQACSIDGVPSLQVNGYNVVINTVVPKGSVNLQLWAPFVLPFSLHTGRTESLGEDKNKVALRLEAFKTPWRWNFGDGTPAKRGFSAQHVFARPGVFKVTVEAYFPSHSFWYTFDAVQLHVVSGSA